MNPTAVSIADIRDMTKDIGVISFDCVGLTSSLVLAGKEGLGSRASVSSPGVEIEAHSVRLVISSNSCRPRTGRNAFVQTIEVEYDTFAIMVIAAAAMGIHCRGEWGNSINNVAVMDPIYAKTKSNLFRQNAVGSQRDRHGLRGTLTRVCDGTYCDDHQCSDSNSRWLDIHAERRCVHPSTEYVRFAYPVIVFAAFGTWFEVVWREEANLPSHL
jgi:hypothetical protein